MDGREGEEEGREEDHKLECFFPIEERKSEERGERGGGRIEICSI